jgi:hypothetical protein
MNICSVEDCGKRHFSNGLCTMHYERQRIHLDRGECSVDGCESRVKARKMCNKHYQRWYKNGGSKSIVKNYSYKNWHNHLNVSSPLWENDCFIHGIGCTPQEYAWLELMCDEPLIEHRSETKFKDLRYCLHKEHYAPMCKKVHNRMDDSGHTLGIGLDGVWNEVAVVSIPGTVIAQWGEEGVFHE